MSEKIRHGTLGGGAWIGNRPSCYTPAQTLRYLNFIKLDLGISEDDISKGSVPTSLEHLTLLVQRSLLAISWENTSMHYSEKHSMDVSPLGMYEHAVVRRKGGSYCFGLNSMLVNVLLALGYRAYSGAARVRESIIPTETETYTTLSHEVIFVQPVPQSNTTYLVDIGFGSAGLVRPILLSNQESNEVHGVCSSELHRLTRAPFELSSIDTNKGASHEIKWHLEVLRQHSGKDDPSEPRWRTLYAFSEEEFYPKDFEAASFVASQMPSPKGLFWSNLVAVRLFVLKDLGLLGLGQIGHGRIEETGSGFDMARMILIGRELKCNIGDGTILIKTFSNEAERINTLRDVFGVALDDNDSEYIVGRAAAIVAT
ncbi:arylamine N-acetyltransferase 1 [Crepidotus variabilis]|uniref:Arylamine N-acetyltransferase 1 n=1 Tax=Crepidotus variabilis TaxID=179855 RepID=A0A9P6E9E0_9AGAR|nr:arylamine N-acetyltransferase 1 [Crepidotus variabilis]